MTPTSTLEGTTCIVTGGARGIGLALADAFLAAGATGVTVVDLVQADCDRAAAELAEAHGDRVLGLAADVTDESAVTAVVAATEARFGPVGLFAANAGIGAAADLSTDLSVWNRVWEVNTLSHVVAARAVVPAMIERGGGTFVTTASAAGLLIQIGDGAYTATKHAAVGFAEWLAVTHGDDGIRVHCLCPQGVNTDLLRSAMGLSEAVDTVALHGVIEPADAAAATVAAIEEGRFLVLPHPEVADYLAKKVADPDRWLAGMRRLQDRVRGLR